MDEQALRESDLLAFEIGLEIGQPGAVMCGYNQVNGAYACENSFLLQDVLRRDWGYKGFVMSDWGAVHSTSIRQGLDQESGANPKEAAWFGAKLEAALAAGRVSQADIDRSALRILRAMYAQCIESGRLGAMKARRDHHDRRRIDAALSGQIEAVCESAGVPILSDAAEALGAYHGGRPAGSFGAAVFTLWRAHSDEHDVGFSDMIGQVG